MLLVLRPWDAAPPAARPHDAASAAEAASPDAVAAPSARLAGRIELPQGCEAATTKVVAFDAAGTSLAETAPAADGTFRLEAPGAAGVLAVCPGFPAALRRLDETCDREALVLAPVAACTLAVRVLDDRGLPVAGALVAPDSVDAAWTAGERRILASVEAVRSSVEGLASLAVRASGTVEVLVEAPGHVAARTDPVALPFDQPLEVELPRGGRLRGEVLDAAGAPRPGARVRVVGSGLWPAREFPADASGRFDAGMLPPGFYEAEAFEGSDVSSLQRGIEVQPAADTSVRLTLAPGGFLAGRVTFEGAAAPADGVVVTVHGLRARLVPIRAAPAADGRFRVGPLQPGRHLVRSVADPFLPGEAWAEVAAGETVEVELALRVGRTLRGRVVGPDNAPVAGARLTLSGRADDGSFVLRSPTTEALAALDRRGLAPVGRLLPIGELGVLEGPLPPIPPRPFAWLDGRVPEPDERAGGGTTGPAAPAALTTDRQGEFVLAGLPPGTFAVTVTHADFAPLSQEVAVAAAEPATSVVLRLAEGCTLAGLVKDDGDRPVAGANVRVLSGGMEPLLWRTDDSGLFTARHLPPHVALRVQLPGFFAADLELELTGTPCAGQVDVVLRRLGGRVAGRVLDARRFPVANARVKVEPVGGAARWAAQGTVSAADGTFGVGAPAEERLRVVATHPDYVETALETAPAEDLELVLRRGVRLRGTVVDEVGRPVAAHVSLRADGRELRAVRAGTDGTFDAGRVPAGTYEVRAGAEGFADAAVLTGVDEPPQDSAATERSVELVLRRGVVLEGRVVDRFDAPVAGAAVEARLRGSRLPAREARTDADGRFTLAGLPPGTWDVTAEREGMGRVAADATLDVGTRSRPVELVFRTATVPAPGPGDAAAPETPSSGRVGYSQANDEVLVRAPAAYHAPGTDPLSAGDRILVVERETIADLEQLRAVVARMHRATLSIAVLRDGRRRFLTVDRQALLAEGW
ncbi:MAG: carboxypeptidase regulatory-like domain-containing protein [Deltaproteobacteria bacterium]|nr:carboxypeptidase regulatory-like domain-containing protein [Deltaproteobacteria bacterium]